MSLIATHDRSLVQAWCDESSNGSKEGFGIARHRSAPRDGALSARSELLQLQIAGTRWGDVTVVQARPRAARELKRSDELARVLS